MRIIRHQLEITDYQTVFLQNEGDLLSVAQSRTEPNGLIDLWSLDYESGASGHVALYIIGTGNPMPPELHDDRRFFVGERQITPQQAGYLPKTWRKFIGTVVTPIGLVWHVFEGPVQAPPSGAPA